MRWQQCNISVFFSASPFPFAVGEQTSWLRCCWGLELQTSLAASGEQRWWQVFDNLTQQFFFVFEPPLLEGLTKCNYKTSPATKVLFPVLIIFADSPASALSPLCQTVQEEGAGESGGALRLQRLRLPDGDDRPRQTAQLHRRRSESRDSCFVLFCFFLRLFIALFAERRVLFTRCAHKRNWALLEKNNVNSHFLLAGSSLSLSVDIPLSL